jgi:L,D-transpeptidase ErfK/SrfK
MLRMGQRMRARTLSKRLLTVATYGVALAIAGGCQSLTHRKSEQPQAIVEAAAPLPEDPRATHEFVISADNDVVGVTQVTRTGPDDTLSDIARRFNLGFEEIVRANPGVDPWIPGADREIVLPTQFVLPDAPREGLVINLPALRVFYFPKAKPGEPQRVITHPIGIGKVGWSTPEGTTKVVSKRKNPIWTPPASVRKEHAENGDPLPMKVPPGPDNPLGVYAMTLGWDSYLIHGTNKPYGVGMRSSHGCMRFYPEDIALLFDQIPVGTRVHVVNQPFLIGWHDGAIYIQAMPQLEDDNRPELDATGSALNSAISDRLWQKVKTHAIAVNLESVAKIVKDQRGIALPVSQRDLSPEQFLTAQPRVHNQIPKGATWDGKEELLVTAEEYEAARAGKPLPKKPTPKTPPIKEASSTAGSGKAAGSR